MHPGPETPRIYDALEAKAFVAAWTGLDPALIEWVQDAKFRYLELAGLPEEDGISAGSDIHQMEHQRMEPIPLFRGFGP